MKIALFTSSRADFGIYLPLLKALKGDSFFELHIMAFGTHLSEIHGNTVDQIIADGFDITFRIDTMPESDLPVAISQAMGKTIIDFAEIWNTQTYELVIALGDRYEMFAACSSIVPFGIPITHIHGGETTLGAIDDCFRHCITQMSTYHFTTTDLYRRRVIELKGNDNHVYNVGALSIDNLMSLSFYSIQEFRHKFNIDLNIPTILITFHPETVDFKHNEFYVKELIAALWKIQDYQFIITMPNADTMGNMIREQLAKFISKNKQAIGIESFGTLGYLSCMKNCSMMLGNTSSGFVEASYFNKYVINLGDRQKGRIITDNIFNCEINEECIVAAVENYKNYIPGSEPGIYGDGNTARKIIEILKNANA